MKKAALLVIQLCLTVFTYGQSRKVLFIGNSYTGLNDLPKMVADLASSANDTLFFDSGTPGGAAFYAHSLYTITIIHGRKFVKQ